LTAKLIQPIEGDLDKEGLGISVDDRNLIKDTVQVFIHGAADVDYQSHIHVALRRNYFAALSLQKLAKESKKALLFTFVSTLGVHLDKADYKI